MKGKGKGSGSGLGSGLGLGLRSLLPLDFRRDDRRLLDLRPKSGEWLTYHRNMVSGKVCFSDIQVHAFDREIGGCVSLCFSRAISVRLVCFPLN